jgi:PAS domain S-box-containing protein
MMFSETTYLSQAEKEYVAPGIHPLVMGNEFLANHFRSPYWIQKDVEDFTQLSLDNHWRVDPSIQPFLTTPRFAIVVTDVQECIAWVSSGFTRMTGYTLPEVTGRKPGLLQGEGTSPQTKSRIRMRVNSKKVYSGDILNYRKNGQPYYCHLRISPLYALTGELMHYIAIEREIRR